MAETIDFIADYRHRAFLKLLFVIFCFAVLLVVIGYALTVGQGLSFSESYSIIWNHITGAEYPVRTEMWWKDHFIWDSVMPRIVVGIIGGAGLAVGGAVMQSVMSNPLADPYTTGIASGATLGAVAAIIAGVSFTSMVSGFGIVVNAFVGALIPALVVIAISRRISNSPATLILVGTAISYFFNAAITLLMMMASEEDLQSAYIWQVGTLTGMTWNDVPLMLTVTVIGSIIVMLVSKQLNLLTMGENSAKSLGLDVGQFRLLCLVLLSFMTAAIVSYTGTIGFVGLVSPHIARIVIGSDNRIVIPAAIIVGALMLTSCDLASRIISNISDIPVGAVLSLIGSPIFLILVIGRKKGSGVYRCYSTERNTSGRARMRSSSGSIAEGCTGRSCSQRSASSWRSSYSSSPCP